MQSYYTFIALDLANERSRETQRRRLRGHRPGLGSGGAALDPAVDCGARRDPQPRVRPGWPAWLDEDANIGEALIGRSMADTCN